MPNVSPAGARGGRVVPPWLVAALIASAVSAGLLWRPLAGITVLSGPDYLGQYYPDLEFAARSWREAGGVPRWQPNLFGGVPFLGGINKCVLYPTEILAWLTACPVTQFYAGDAVVHEALAAAGAAVLAGLEGCAGTACVLAGVAYALSGATLTQLGVATVLFHRAAAWMPWLIAGLRSAGRRRPAGIRLAALAWGAMWLTGAAQMALYAAVIAALLLAWECAERLGQRPALPHPFRHAAGSGVRYAVAAALGAAGGAVWLLPASIAVRESVRGVPGASLASQWALTPWHAADLIWPGIWGAASTGSPGYFGPFVHDAMTFSPGLLTLVLGGIGMASGLRRAGPWALVTLAGIILATGQATPAGRWLGMLPLFSAMRGWNRWCHVASLGLCVLAGLGWEGTLAATRGRRVLVWTMAVAAALQVSAWIMTPHITEAVRRSPPVAAHREVWAQEPEIVTPTVGRSIRMAAGRAVIGLGVTLAAVAVPSAWGGVLITGWMTAELALIDAPFLRGESVADFFRPDPVGDDLLARPRGYRIRTEEDDLAVSGRVGGRLEFVSGYHTSPPRPVFDLAAIASRSADPLPILRIFGVRYHVVRAPASSSGLNLMTALSTAPGGPFWIYEDPAALRRIWFPRREIQAPGGAAALMSRPGWTWRTAVLDGMTTGGRRLGVVRSALPVVGADERSVEVDVQGEAMAVLAEPGVSGWRALLDGGRSRVFRVDAALLGVTVPSGHHHLRFVYDPVPLRLGLWLSIVTAIGSLIALVAPRIPSWSAVRRHP